MNEANVNDSDMNNSNSKINIEANSLNHTKTIEIKENSNVNLSRVDSQNYPDETKNLDDIARKLRLNKHLTENDQSNHLSKIDEGASHDSPASETRKEILKPQEDVIPDTPSKSKSKKRNFLNIFRRISHHKSKSNKSTPKNQPKTDPSKETPKKVSRQKSLRKILLKFGRKKDKPATTGDGPSSISSSITNNPLSGDYTVSCNDITDENIRCNMNKKDIVSVDNINCIIDKSRDNSESTISTDEILNVQAKAFIDSKNSNNNNNNRTVLPSEMNSSNVPIESPTSDNTNYKSPLIISTSSPPPNLDNQNNTVLESQASCLSTKSDNPIGRSNIKLSLALYGYGNYGGLRSSRKASRSCMEFWSFQDSSNNNNPSKHNSSSPFTNENSNGSVVMRTTTTTPIKSKSIHENMLSSDPSHNRTTKLRSRTIDKQELGPIREKQVASMVITNGNHEFNVPTNHNETPDASTNQIPEAELSSPADCKNTSNSTVLMRSQSNRPGDIQLRKSRGVSANHTRSSLIMLAVTHNSPRGKSVHPIKTPQSPTQLAIGSYSPPPCMKLTENGEALDQYSCSSPTNTGQLDSNLGLVEGDSSNMLANQTNGDVVSDNLGNRPTSPINATVSDAEKDGQYYLNQVNKCEVDILLRVDDFQNDLDRSEELGINNEIQDQLRAIIGKSKLLVSEKFDQFRGLCEQNLTDTVADEGYRTLVSDLDGFWSMVLIQVDEITKEIDRCDTVKKNGWKEVDVATMADQVDSGNGVNTPKKKRVVKKRVPKSSGTSAKNSPHKKPTSGSDLERAKAARQRIEEFKRKAMAAKQLQSEAVPATLNNDSEIMIIQ